MQVVILAGGSGTRLWPISTDTYPKQFIKFMTHSFYQRALLLANAVGAEISVVTVEKYRQLVEDQAREIYCPLAEIIIEPAARGTCPAIALACRHILERVGNEPMLILPSDHYIGKFDELAKIISSDDVSRSIIENICLFGYENVNLDWRQYGWIQPSQDTRSAGNTHKVFTFVEKPEKAINSDVLVNMGIFYCKPSNILKWTALWATPCFSAIYDPKEYLGLDRSWASFDRSILSREKVNKVYVDCSHVDWSDMGSFAALREHFPDLENIYDHFRLQPKKEHPINTNITQKPWGWYENLTSGPGYLVKMLHINPNSRLSDQFHKNRKEVWIPLGEGGTVERNSLLGNAKVTTSLKKWVAVEVDALRRHRLQNSNSGEPLEVLEIQVGEPDENDIVRLEDDYGRIDEPVDNA